GIRVRASARGLARGLVLGRVLGTIPGRRVRARRSVPRSPAGAVAVVEGSSVVGGLPVMVVRLPGRPVSLLSRHTSRSTTSTPSRRPWTKRGTTLITGPRLSIGGSVILNQVLSQQVSLASPFRV